MPAQSHDTEDTNIVTDIVTLADGGQQWAVAHCVPTFIDQLIAVLKRHPEHQEQRFYDEFFGKELVRQPTAECWLKVRTFLPTTSGDADPGVPGQKLSLKTIRPDEQPERPTAERPYAHFSFTLLTTREDIFSALERLGRSKTEVSQLEPFLTLFVHRISLKSGDGSELWVDAARLVDCSAKTFGDTIGATIGAATSFPSVDVAAGGMSHKWFVSAGWRFPPSYRGSVLEMFGLSAIGSTEDLLYWAPSKAYYFTDRMWDARNRLKIQDTEDWTPVMYTRQLNPLSNTRLILPKTEGAVETKVVDDWLDAWAAALTNVPDSTWSIKMDSHAIQQRLQTCLNAIIAAAEKNSFRRDQHSLYLLAESCFVPSADIDTVEDAASTCEFDHDAAGALYAMLHLWEARVPLTLSLLEQFRERIYEVCVDPTASMSTVTDDKTAAASTQDQHGPCGSAATRTVELGGAIGDKLASLIDDMRDLSYAQMGRLLHELFAMPFGGNYDKATRAHLIDLFVRQYNRFERISAAFCVFQGYCSSSVEFSYNDDY